MRTQSPQRLPLAFFLAAWLGSSASIACGPDFPVTLLDQREAVLMTLPEGNFYFEAQRLLPAPTDGFSVVEFSSWEAPDGSLRDAEAAGLSPSQQQQVLAMRAAADLNAAQALAEGLPDEVREYTLGAVAWHIGDVESAQRHFQAVLDLPPDAQVSRGLMAQYMLGRVQALFSDADARQSFQAVRARVRAGAADPLGLATTSLGEEARLALRADNIELAIAGYAEQAAYGDQSGLNSLLVIGRSEWLREPDRVSQLLQGPLGRQLALAYLFSRSHELPPDDGETQDWPPPTPPNSKALLDLLHALDLALPAADAGRDRLAAIAYRAGRYDDAHRVLGSVESPLASWVRAKLALRAGDIDAATAAYASAIERFPPSEEWGSSPQRDADGYSTGSEDLAPRCRVSAEAGILALSRGDSLQAMQLFYDGGERYWSDAHYLAERVLTVDELQVFVDRVAPQAQFTADRDDWTPLAPAEAIRWLLARRLMREGRGDDAIAYFDDPALREKALRYVGSVATLNEEDGLEAAQAGFAAAELARWDGMELLGYEGDPDYREWGGQFDLNDPTTWDDNYQPVFNPRSDLQPQGSFTAPDELVRLRYSVANPLQRFHYRYIAADLAARAADQLPPRSQAFAAVLCQATRYVLNRAPEHAQSLYQRYLKEGAYVPWGAAFGQTCPAPDFAKVAGELRSAQIAKVKRIGLFLLPVLVVALGVWAWLRQRGAKAKGAQ
ncbi:MAG: hypothetical protein R3F04_14940 [Lysobacteraceae bacterium]